MIVSMMLTPLMMLFPRIRFIRWLLHHRRDIGLAAFLYAALHLTAYLLHERSLDRILSGFAKWPLVTGWAAFAIFLVLALTSSDRAQHWLGSQWKNVQRTIYAAAILVLLHWVQVSHGVGGIIVHFAPLALLEFYRIGWNMKWWRFHFG